MIEIKSGSVVGTGAAINVELGFIPDHVRVVNVTDGDRIDEWFYGMTDGTAVTITTAVATTASNGISGYVGDSTHSKGFTIGSGVSESAKTLFYIASRGAY